MPGLARRILIFAAVDGLILQPAPPRNHKPTTDQAIKIEYKSNIISPLQKDRRQEETAPQTLDAHGIVGLLKISSSSFLVSITAREQVAQIRNLPIYSISEVALIPLSSKEDAERAITRAHDAQLRRQSTLTTSASNDEYTDDDEHSSPEEGSLPATPPSEPVDLPTSPVKRQTSIAEDVITRKGLYGRFAERWFSKKGWKTDARRNQGISSEEDLAAGREAEQGPTLAEAETQRELEDPAAVGTDSNQENANLANTVPEEAATAVGETQEGDSVPLLPKVLMVSKMLFGSKNFYFAYDYDLSRSLKDQPSSSSTIPLHKTFDPLFFWNRHLITPFIEAGQDSFIMPLIQGFIGQRAFTINQPEGEQVSQILNATSKQDDVEAMQYDPDYTIPSRTEENVEPALEAKGKSRNFVLTLVSRRSVKRAGLRYLRRGIDEEGHVANSVETEQLVSTPDWGSGEKSKIYSFLQYRGSIPVIFSQSPYSFKPVVVFSGSQTTNTAAFRLHFKQLAARYGKVQATSLVETKGNEGKIGEAYATAAASMNKEGGMDGKGNLLAFEWFDFHGVCKGMKFENVSQLFDRIGPNLKSYGWSVKQKDETLQKQDGIMRTNCMDCLDRTNVVQSALARNILEAQLADQGITIDLNSDPTTSWFNNLWADNGDAISRQYAGTAALKGDFTRTRKRNITGALTDFGLTLTRYYNNIVNDYFAQAVIDYLLGYTNESSFIDFEADMKLQDYAVDLHKVRQGAIETCFKICVEEKEDLIAGWVLSCPNTENTLRSLPFEECVLLLTAHALYFCRMDWTTEKVREFQRVDLDCVDAIARGVYITSAVAKRDLDEAKNFGFVVRIATRGRDMVRVNTRSLANEKEDGVTHEAKGGEEGGESQQHESKLLAFKALPAKGSFVAKGEQGQNQPGESVSIKLITDEVAKAANAFGSEGSSMRRPGKPRHLQVEEKDIISADDAKRSTGYIEQLGYSLKKLVWAS